MIGHLLDTKSGSLTIPDPIGGFQKKPHLHAADEIHSRTQEIKTKVDPSTPRETEIIQIQDPIPSSQTREDLIKLNTPLRKTCSNRKKRGEQRPCEFHTQTRRLERKGQAVELDVDEVADGVAGLAARGDVRAASLLDGDGDYGGIS